MTFRHLNTDHLRRAMKYSYISLNYSLKSISIGLKSVIWARFQSVSLLWYWPSKDNSLNFLNLKHERKNTTSGIGI